MNAARKRVSLGLKVAALVVLTTHFALTLLYCFPTNPLKLEAYTLLDATIGRFFSQNWSLFAPDPLQANQSMLVHCMTGAEADAARGRAGLPSAGWTDISVPLIKRHQENRFSAYDRISRAATNALREWLGNSPAVADIARECSKGNAGACEREKSARAAARAATEPLIARIASSFCLDDGQAGRVTYVAVRGRTADAQPWSKRYEAPAPEVRDFDVGVFPIDSDVESSGLYQRRM